MKFLPTGVSHTFTHPRIVLDSLPPSAIIVCYMLATLLGTRGKSDGRLPKDAIPVIQLRLDDTLR